MRAPAAAAVASRLCAAQNEAIPARATFAAGNGRDRLVIVAVTPCAASPEPAAR